MALHPCFQPAFPHLPIPTPLQKLALASRIRSRRVTPTRRQCCGAVWRHRQTVERSCWGALGNAAELSGTEAVRGDLTTELHLHWWLTCNNYSNRIQSFARCSQPGQPGFQHQGTLHAHVGAAVPLMVPEEWDPPSWAGWPTLWYPWTADSAQLNSARCPREVRNYISICERCTVVPCFREKGGNMMLGMVVW